MAKRHFLLAIGLACAIAAPGEATASTVVGLSIEDQARLSEMVVVGEVLNVRGVRHPRFGVESAVTLKVEEVLKGNASEGQAVLFHSRSGEAEGEISEAIGEAVFSPGEKVLVFIESVDGRRYNLGLSMGVWNLREDREGRVSYVRALTDGLSIIGEEAVELGPIGAETMRGRVESTRRSPRFDSEALRGLHGQGR